MEAYRRILIETLLQQGLILSFLEVGSISLAVDSLARINRGLTSTEKQQGWRQDVRISAVIGVLGTIIIGYMLVSQCFGMVKDIVKDQYICTQCVYQRENDGVHAANWFSNGSVQITVDGESFWLKLPRDHSYEKYPFGRREGTVWYGENSKVIVAFSTTAKGTGTS